MEFKVQTVTEKWNPPEAETLSALEKKLKNALLRHFENEEQIKKMSEIQLKSLVRLIPNVKASRFDESLKKTIEYAQGAFDLHKEYNISKIVKEEFKEEEEAFKFWPTFHFGHDKNGHPVVYEQSGRLTTKGAKFFQKGQNLQKYRIREFCRSITHMEALRKISGKEVGRIFLICDIDGFGLLAANSFKDQIKRVIDMLDKLPRGDYVSKIVLINASWTFRGFWNVISLFVPKPTAEKILVLGSSYLSELKKYIDLDQIPKEYGGKSELKFKSGIISDDLLPDLATTTTNFTFV